MDELRTRKYKKSFSPENPAVSNLVIDANDSAGCFKGVEAGPPVVAKISLCAKDFDTIECSDVSNTK